MTLLQPNRRGFAVCRPYQAGHYRPRRQWLPQIAWVICGVEKASEPRYMEPDWARDIRDQCQPIDGCAFLMKQMTDGNSVPIPIDLQIEPYPI